MLKLKNHITVIHIILGFLAFSEISFAQTHKLEEIKTFALKGNDSTLILLDRVKPEIDFINDTEIAFEYLLIHFTYYHARRQKRFAKEMLKACEPYYEQSKNEYLKLYYEIGTINLGSYALEKYESKIRKCRDKAIKLGFSDILFEANYFLFKMYRRENEKDSLKHYMNEALGVAKENNLRPKTAELVRIRGTLSPNEEKAYKDLSKAFEIFSSEGYVIDAARVMVYMARLEQRKNSYEKALEIYHQALEVFIECNLKYDVAHINRILGNIYQEFGNDETALKYFYSAKREVQDTLYPYITARLKRDIAESYITLGDTNQGRKLLQESIAMKEKLRDLFGLAKGYNLLGNLYFGEKAFDLAEQQYENALYNSNKINTKKTKDISYLGLLRIAIEKKEFKLAEKYSTEALDYANKNNSIESKFSILLCLASLAKLQKDFQKSNEYYQASVNLQDSVINLGQSLKITNMIKDYENNKKEIEILKLENENSEKAALIEQNKLRSTLYIISLFASLFILLMLIRSYIQNKKASEEQQKLNISLNESNLKISESNLQLERFAHMVSHDLKAPLATITSFASLIEEKTTSKLNDDEKLYFDFITKSGKSLSDMIDDMLAYSKIDSQNVNLVLSDMNIVIADVFSSFAGHAMDNAIELKQLTAAPKCMFDKFKMKRVFQNLISNSIKFSDLNKANSHVYVDYKNLGGFHQFSIKDNGIGIPKTDKDIFEPFVYLNSKDDYQGTGMGLAICQKIIKMHGGEIWYESEMERGTCFYFTVKS